MTILATSQLLTGRKADSSELAASSTDRNIGKCNAVEIEGLCFRPLLSALEVDEQAVSIQEKYVFSIPEKPGGRTSFYPTLKITNNSTQPVNVARFGLITASLVSADGKPVEDFGLAWNAVLFNPVAVGSVLILPGESVNLSMKAILFWNQNILYTTLAGKYFKERTTFFDLKPGVYKLQLTYQNDIDEVENGLDPRQFSIDRDTPLPELPPPKKHKEVWKGTVKTPVVEFRLVQ